MARTKIKQTPGKEVPAEVLATAIADIGKAVCEMNASRLSRKALVILICHESGLTQREVRAVLDSLDNLERDWLKSK